MKQKVLPTDPAHLDGITKAGVLLLHLEQSAAATLLKSLNPEMVEEVTRVLASLGEIPAALSAAVIEEFYTLRVAHQHMRTGGFSHAKALLEQTLDPKNAARILSQIQSQVQKSPFAFLQKAESENLLTFIQDEHPQTIALVVSHMPHHRASEIIVGLPHEKQVEVIRRIANMERANPEVIREVESGLETRLSSLLSQSTDKVGGVPSVAEVLNLCDRATEKAIMEGIEAEDPELVEQIRRLMFVFEDINMVNDKGIQAVLKEVDNDELALALKTASDNLKNKVFSNMSARASELIQEEMEYMGPVRVSDVEAAQQRIVDIVRRLEDAGEIIISGRGGEKDLIV
ncbi:MAG: flagellar motor switch protein FliG [Phycisphaerales bacterium]